MPLTGWRLHDRAVLFIQFQDDRTESGRLHAFAAIAELARAHGVKGLVIEPKPADPVREAPARLAHHDEVANLIAGSGAVVYVLASPRASSDTHHHVFALQRAGLTARRSAGRASAIMLARRLCRNGPGGGAGNPSDL